MTEKELEQLEQLLGKLLNEVRRLREDKKLKIVRPKPPMSRLEKRHAIFEGFGLTLSAVRWAETLGVPLKSMWRYFDRGLTVEQICELRGIRPKITTE